MAASANCVETPLRPCVRIDTLVRMAVAIFLILGFTAASSTAEEPLAPSNDESHAAERQEPQTPEQALQRLKAGNARFVAGHMMHPDETRARLDSLTAGQQPFAAIVGCSDSRVPPELLFDEGFGDLFVIRVAGNGFAGDVAGSVEYAVEHLQVPLVVVLGHENCGAVGAAYRKVEEPERELADLLHSIESQAHVCDCECLAEAVAANAHATADRLSRLHAMRVASKAGQTKVVAAVYSMADRTVTFLDPSEKKPADKTTSETTATAKK